MFNNVNKIILLLLILSLFFSLFTIFISSEGIPSVSAKSAALYEPETSHFIFSKNSENQLPMASTTKIMTALLALELLDPEEIIQVDDRAIGIEGSSIYLKNGESLTALDLIYSVILQSANDAAAALAYRISGEIADFANLMNERADALGLKNTHFTNPHGLDDCDHYTTAHDLAIISAEALKNENFKKISSTYKKEIKSSETVRTLVNHNKMLKKYPDCIGVKTGFTKKSGRCLVSAAERNGLTLIGVTINAPDDWNDHTKMLDYGYSLIEAKMLAVKGEFSYKIPVINGTEGFVTVSNKDEVKRIFAKNDSSFEISIKMSRYFSAPINKGDILGKVIFTKDGAVISEVDLIAENDVSVKKSKKNFFNFIYR